MIWLEYQQAKRSDGYYLKKSNQSLITVAIIWKYFLFATARWETQPVYYPYPVVLRSNDKTALHSCTNTMNLHGPAEIMQLFDLFHRAGFPKNSVEQMVQ